MKSTIMTIINKIIAANAVKQNGRKYATRSEIRAEVMDIVDKELKEMTDIKLIAGDTINDKYYKIK